MEMSEGFVYCATLDGAGRATPVTANLTETWRDSGVTTWYHLDFSDATALDWISRESGLSELTVAMLTSDDTRPRVTPADGGLAICLRGVNCNPGADPDDMVSLRLWVSDNRILTMRRRRVEAINDIRASLGAGEGPTGSGDFMVALCDSITHRIAEIVGEIDEGVDELEEQMLDQERKTLRSHIMKYRRMVIALRRYVIPQREALSRLQGEKASWLSEVNVLHLRESTERINRCIDDLDATRDRAAVTQEELNARLSEQMNATIYIMSIVATIFLPLGLLTGLLGINVGGIPGADTPWAFLAVCGILVAIATSVYFIFRKKQIL